MERWKRWNSVFLGWAAVVGLCLIAWHLSAQSRLLVTEEIPLVHAIARWAGLPNANPYEYALRKTAHVALFSSVFVALYWGSRNTPLVRHRPVWHAWWLTLMAAAGDELHQSFMAGRDGLVQDVIVDMGVPLLLALYLAGRSERPPADLNRP